MSLRRHAIAILVFLLMLILSGERQALARSIRFVDDDAPLGGDGLAWPTAYRFLQDALSEAAADPTINEIRVAQGTYKPDQDEGGNVTPGDRSATFQLLNNVSLRGGYAALGEPDPDARDIALYETILSGDLAGNDGPNFANNGENCFHIVSALGSLSSAVLDGCSIRGGNGDGPDMDHLGGGLFVEGGTVLINDCIYESNSATSGGGAYVTDGNPCFSSVTFRLNRSVTGFNVPGTGGGLASEGGLLTLDSCVFEDNVGVFGGGLFNFEGDVALNSSTFHGNIATVGGGFENESSNATTITDSTFSGNVSATFGGGIRARNCHLVIDGCLFDGNSAANSGGGLDNGGNMRGFTMKLTDCTFMNNASDQDGAGLYSSPALEGVDVIIDCVFNGNKADRIGGGFYKFGPTITWMANCRFFGNSAGDHGGGMVNNSGSSPGIANCVFSGNSAVANGGAIYNFLNSSPMLVNCTISGNSSGANGGGLVSIFDSPPSILNTILWGNQDAGGMDESAQIHLQDGSARVSYSIIQGLTGSLGGTGNRGDDPLFVDPDGPDDLVGTDDDDLRLMAGSAGIDAGANAALPHDFGDLDGDVDTDELLPTDLGGSPRRLDALNSPDVGAGASPVIDMGAFEHKLDCNGNGVDDSDDIASQTSQDCNTDGIPDECELSPDCNGNGTCDDEDVMTGSSEDCNGNNIPDECEADCNGNGLHDECDIQQGTSEDCNGDNVPDECLDSSLDCNGNGVVDACETASGAIPDVNGNGFPDECEPSVLFVNVSVGRNENGTSWGDAFNDLQSAIGVASNSIGSVQEIWVAAGTYVAGENRFSSFTLPDGVAIYGGFAGGETSLIQPDPTANPTILSGDLNDDDVGDFDSFTRMDNSYHVLVSADTSSATILDGFIIEKGNATPFSPIDRHRGAGLWNNGSAVFSSCVFRWNWTVGDGAGVYSTNHPTLVNCIFEENAAEIDGGGMYNDGIDGAAPQLISCVFLRNEAYNGAGLTNAFGAVPTIDMCAFIGNSARFAGGGVYNDNNNNATFSNCIFSGNMAETRGGGYYDLNSEATVANCTFSGNNSNGSSWAGGMAASPGIGKLTTVANCIFWGNSNANGIIEAAQVSTGPDGTVSINYSCIEGLTGQLGGSGNIGLDPLFVDAAGADGIIGTIDDDVGLLEPSPCVDAGDPLIVPDPNASDFDGEPRVMGCAVDMGADEVIAGIPHSGDVNANHILEGTDIPLFVAAILGTPSQQVVCIADIDENGTVTMKDVETFVACILAGECP